MFSGKLPFDPLKVKLLAGDLRAAQDAVDGMGWDGMGWDGTLRAPSFWCFYMEPSRNAETIFFGGVPEKKRPMYSHVTPLAIRSSEVHVPPVSGGLR